jgi:hypothetical protein
MQLNVNLSVEIETALRRRAAAAGEDLETFVSHVVAEEVADEVQRPRKKKTSSEGFAQRLDAWTKLHPVLDRPIDDSRESIYAGRGE